ncbi:hypothetical protein [[Phormidium] sp. ETS-05]|uniref:hypothetical protein n=1 Tax=[Phormidium] sp. ETS-05 TaxID=222819 RepID=UPI0018EF0DB1|nr:hypothetical protein [[Phormidium] sp. ETS-05]
MTGLDVQSEVATADFPSPIEPHPRWPNLLGVVHVSTGRVRLRAKDANGRALLDAIAQQFRQQQGVEEVSHNHTTGSLCIKYNPHILSPAKLREFLQDRFGIGEQSSAWTDAGWQPGNEINSLLPPIMGILTTNRLGIQGWGMIPAYLMTSQVAKEVIQQLEIEFSGKSGQSISQLNTHNVPTDKALGHPEQRQVAYHIVSYIPGRIRFHIPRLAKDGKYAKRLMKLSRAETRIKQARVNRDTASWVVSYQTQSPSDPPDLGSQNKIAVARLIKLIQSAAMATPKSQTMPVAVIPNTLPIESEIKSDYRPEPVVLPPEETGVGWQPEETGVVLPPEKPPELVGWPLEETLEPVGWQPEEKPDFAAESANNIDIDANLQDLPAKTMWYDCKSTTLRVMLNLMANLSV